MKVNVRAERNLFNQPTGSYIASFGEWHEKGNSPLDAKRKLQEAIEWFMRVSITDPVIIADAKDSIFLLCYTFHGYEIKRVAKQDGVEKAMTFLGRILPIEARVTLFEYAQQYQVALTN